MPILCKNIFICMFVISTLFDSNKVMNSFYQNIVSINSLTVDVITVIKHSFYLFNLSDFKCYLNVVF